MCGSQLIGRLVQQTQRVLYLQKKMQSKQQQRLKAFLKKQENALSKQILTARPEDIKARILSLEDIEQAAQLLQQGKLVAFPTQTVYGLGANAYDAAALKKIYQTKKRPLTDPIIVHVLDTAQAEKLVVLGEKQRRLFDLLTGQFWPGPLTIILKANLQLLPMMVTAQTGFVGIRAPRHPYARHLIEASGLPIGAPSANLFSHVSPTQPVHVFNDFFNCDVSIVEGGRCEFGVESTVIKLVEDEIQVFREGSLSVGKLQAFLREALKGEELPEVSVLRRVEGKQTNMEAPGQLLKHYAPYLPCYFFAGETAGKFQNKNGQRFELNEVAFISFQKKRYEGLQQACKYYFEVGSVLQDEGEEGCEVFCSREERLQMREIYYLLRRCENLSVGAIVVGWGGVREGTVWDKVFRSTQGQEVQGLE